MKLVSGFPERLQQIREKKGSKISGDQYVTKRPPEEIRRAFIISVKP